MSYLSTHIWVALYDLVIHIYKLQASVGRPETDRQTVKKQNLKS